jgi:hypothetical protein
VVSLVGHSSFARSHVRGSCAELTLVFCPLPRLPVTGAAHSVGLRTTSTIMFGHLDSPRAWARHLLQLRDLQVGV